MGCHERSERKGILDLLKIICAAFVVLMHNDHSKQLPLYNLFFPLILSKAVPMFLIISGYVNTMSIKSDNLGLMYERKRMVAKILRFLVPYVIFFVGMIVLSAIFPDCNTVGGEISMFFFGGGGSGSYFNAIIVQFVIVYPLIWWMIKKFGGMGYGFCIILCAFFDMYAECIDMSRYAYGYLINSFVGFIALGVYLYYTKEKRVNVLELGFFLLSILISYVLPKYNITVPYIGYGPYSWLSALYLAPIMRLIIAINWKGNKITTFLGNASYNIFLAQQLYDVFIKHWLQDYLYPISGPIAEASLAIIIVVVIGVVFSFFEKPITNCLIAFTRKDSFWKIIDNGFDRFNRRL